MKKKIKWGILGLGGIAHKFADDLLLIDNAEINAVASRSIDKAEAFKKRYNAQQALGSYEELFQSSEVDVIYIATPHTTHKELSIRAMRHGKNVLCEKPIGMDRAEVAEMVAVAREQKVFLMEGLWSRFNPTINKVKELIESGKIGNLGYLHADFSFYALQRPVDSRLLNPDLGGGSLLDIGIYPIFLAYLLLGKPTKISSSSKFLTNGVEIQTSMIFEYPEAQAILYSGLTSESKMEAELSGSEGTFYLWPRWHEANGFTLKQNGETEDVELPTLGIGYTYEIEEVHRCLHEGKKESELWSLQNSIDLMDLLCEVRSQNGIVFPFEQ